MKRFLGYFILEFAIIFLVAYGTNAYFHGTMGVISIVISAAVAGAIIAGVAARTKMRRCGEKTDAVELTKGHVAK